MSPSIELQARIWLLDQVLMVFLGSPRHMYTATALLPVLLLPKLKCVQEQAVPGRAITSPSPQPGLLAHASQHKAAAFGNVQSIHKPLRWQAPKLTEPLGA